MTEHNTGQWESLEMWRNQRQRERTAWLIKPRIPCTMSKQKERENVGAIHIGVGNIVGTKTEKSANITGRVLNPYIHRHYYVIEASVSGLVS